MKLTFIPFLLLAVLARGQQERAMGLVMDDEEYRQLPHVSDNIQIFPGRRSVVTEIDLAPFCPAIGDQGTIASCVGWSIGYGAMTIERAVKNEWSNPANITENANSALFIYNQVNKGDCGRGIKIPEALELLQEKGNCLAKDFDRIATDCNVAVSESLIKKAGQFRIEDFIPLFQPDAPHDDKILNTRLILSQKKPVIVGFEILRNFQTIKKGEDRWWPTLGDQVYAGTHAMVVVGFDDEKFRGPDENSRGAFKLMNSWGTNWGENGFIWIRYKDFAQYCRHAFAIRLADSPPLQWPAQETTPPPVKPLLPVKMISGAFGFRHYLGMEDGIPQFEDADVQLQGTGYRLSGPYKRGSGFQLQVYSGHDEGYVYVFSLDPNGKAEVHFPRSVAYNVNIKGSNESALIPTGGSTLIIPAARRILTIDDIGQDHLIVLFSTRKIGPEYLHRLMDELARGEGSLSDRLPRALKQDMVPLTDIVYTADKMGFEAKAGAGGSIIPILLTVDVED